MLREDRRRQRSEMKKIQEKDEEKLKGIRGDSKDNRRQ